MFTTAGPKLRPFEGACSCGSVVQTPGVGSEFQAPLWSVKMRSDVVAVIEI